MPPTWSILTRPTPGAPRRAYSQATTAVLWEPCVRGGRFADSLSGWFGLSGLSRSQPNEPKKLNKPKKPDGADEPDSATRTRRETLECYARPSITNPAEQDSLSWDGYYILQIPPTCFHLISDRSLWGEPSNHCNRLKHIG
jgi:hypothetical protein